MSRRVGGVYLTDRWAVARALEIDYGIKLDRYDYLADPNLFSGALGVRAAVAPRTVLVARVSPHMAAPGADQFLPPATSGVWLPPERTFSSLDAGQPVAARARGALRHAPRTRLRAGDNSPVVRGGRFTEVVSNQIATLFGLDGAPGTGHYFISSPGDVRVDGWVIGMSGSAWSRLRGTID